MSVKFQYTSFSRVPKEEWNALLMQSASKNLFYHYEFLRATEGNPEAYRPDAFVAGYENGRLVLIAPIRIHKKPIGKSVHFFNFLGNHIEPLVAEGRREELLKAFMQFLLHDVQPDLITGRFLSREFSEWLKKQFPALQVRFPGKVGCPILELPGTIDEFWARYKSRFRSEFRRTLRRADEQGISFRAFDARNAPEGYSLEQALGNLSRLYSLRNEVTDRQSGFLDPMKQQFHTRLCRQLTAEKDPFILFTEALFEGQVIGSSYGLFTPHRFAGFSIGFDPEFDKFGLGHLIIYATIEEAIRRGVKTFDFMRGSNTYKAKWTEEEDVDKTVYVILNLRGKILLQRQFFRRYVQTKGPVTGSIQFVKNLVGSSFKP